jgi:PST family polysaccharide transporter
MATLVSSFLQIFKDAGLSTATIQREKITHAQVSNLFWINLALSVTATVLMILTAPLTAWFFDEPALIAVSIALSLGFVFEGLAVQHVALLNRQMRFKVISAVEVGCAVAGFSLGIVMAVVGWGYWSLVGATLATGGFRVISAWLASPWRPQRPMRRSGTRPLVTFGADLTLVGIVFAFARGFDSLLIGRFLGPDAVGLYSRATALLTRPMERLVGPINAVIVPALSRLQDQPERYRRTYLLVFEGLAIAGSVFAGIFLPLADPVVTVVLGPLWVAAAPIFAALSLAALFLPLSISTSWLYTSQGRGRELLGTALCHACAMIAGFLAGLPFGATGVAVGYSASGVLVQLPITCYIAGRRGPVSSTDLWFAFIRHVPLFLVVLGVTLAASLATTQFSASWRLLVCLPAGLLGAAGVVLLSRNMRNTAGLVLGALKELKAR